MTLFDGKPIELRPKSNKIILSASRMTDMPKYYPYELMDEVNRRVLKGEDIHTLVLVTKHAKALLVDPLNKFLLELRDNKGIQLFIHLTITGLGALIVGKKSNGKPLILEPHVPSSKETLPTLPDLINLVGRPERIRVRIDPIVRLIDSEGKEFSSLKIMPHIVGKASAYAIKEFSFSLLEKNIYKKS